MARYLALMLDVYCRRQGGGRSAGRGPRRGGGGRARSASGGRTGRSGRADGPGAGASGGAGRPRAQTEPRRVPGSRGRSPAARAQDAMSTLGPGPVLGTWRQDGHSLSPHPHPKSQSVEARHTRAVSSLVGPWPRGHEAGITQRRGQAGLQGGSEGHRKARVAGHGPQEGGGPRPLCPIALGGRAPEAEQAPQAEVTTQLPARGTELWSAQGHRLGHRGGWSRGRPVRPRHPGPTRGARASPRACACARDMRVADVCYRQRAKGHAPNGGERRPRCAPSVTSGGGGV